MTHVNGQIWIDKNTPNHLKYRVLDHDYEISTATNALNVRIEEFETLPDKTLYAGTLLAISGKNNVVPAVFPEDLDNIIGIALSKATPESPAVSMDTKGYLKLEKAELEKVMLPDDLDTTKNGWKDVATKDDKVATVGIGAPVYWFIGRTVKNSEGEYSYQDSSSRDPYLRGHITFTTPSGYKWLKTTVNDPTLNVGYNNLPQIGTVSKYTLKSGKITSLEIYLNFSQFTSSLEWSWPYIHSEDCGKEERTIDTEGKQVSRQIDIRHGLFADNNLDAHLRNFCDVTALEQPTSTSEINVATTYENYYKGTNTDRRTVINISTPETLYYRVMGTVNYKFDKGHKDEVVDGI